MAEYEVAILYHPDLETDLDKATSKVEKLFASADAKITATDIWGKRKLAYPIKKQDYAVYAIYTLEMPGDGVAKLETGLNITDEVIRFLITKPDLKAIAKAEAAKADKAKKAAERGDRATDDDRDDTEEE